MGDVQCLRGSELTGVEFQNLKSKFDQRWADIIGKFLVVEKVRCSDRVDARERDLKEVAPCRASCQAGQNAWA